MAAIGEKIATREAYGNALAEFGAKYENVVVLDADLAEATKTVKFKKAFPERFFDCGIAEGNMVAIAAGIATDTLGKLTLPEGKTLLGAHRFNLLDLGEFITGKLRYSQRLSQLLIRNFISSALAHQAFVQQHVSLRQTLFTISGVDNNLITVYAHADDTLSTGSLNLVDIQHTAAGCADGVDKLTLNAVILQQLVHSVCIARL